jgi:predicted RNA-binding Zn-ribbon protein involved in translation (DUF1610 family)
MATFVPVSRVARFICSKNGVRYDVTYTRYAASSRYKISRIAPSAGAGSNTDGMPSASNGSEFAAEDFDLTGGWKCPGCGWDETVETVFWKCNDCGILSCASTRTVDNTVHCLQCGGEGRIEGFIEEISARNERGTDGGERRAGSDARGGRADAPQRRMS